MPALLDEARTRNDELGVTGMLLGENGGFFRAIVHGVVRTGTDVGIGLVAEGIGSEAGFDWRGAEGIACGQGFYVARPGFETLPVRVFAAQARIGSTHRGFVSVRPRTC